MNALNFDAEKPPFMNVSLHKDVTKRQATELCATLLGKGSPYGTFTVNVIGSFIMGVLVRATA